MVQFIWSKAVEQWDLEIYTLILLLLWRYVCRTKNKIETGRPLFPRPWILVKISRTRRGGEDRHQKHSHTTALVVPWTTLSSPTDDSSRLKGYCKTTRSDRFPYFSKPATFFSPVRGEGGVHVMRDTCVTARDFSSKTNLSTWSIGQATTIRCIIQQYFISDSRYSCLSRWSSFCIRVINILIEALENIEVKASNSFTELWNLSTLLLRVLFYFILNFLKIPLPKNRFANI